MSAAATNAFFAVENWGTNNNGNPNYAQRTVLLTNLSGDGVSETTGQVYKLKNEQDSGTQNQKVEHFSVTPPSISRYYSSVSVPNDDNHVNIALQSGWYTKAVQCCRRRDPPRCGKDGYGKALHKGHRRLLPRYAAGRNGSHHYRGGQLRVQRRADCQEYSDSCRGQRYRRARRRGKGLLVYHQ